MDRDEQITQLLTKGVSEVLPSKEFVSGLLLRDKKLTIYCGFDPTAPTLHIGHTIQLRKLRQFQDLGHKVIFLVGDFTARIGDPTDKSAVRKQLTEKEVKKNLALYKKQASKFLRFSGKNKAEVAFNAKWLSKLTFADIINLSSTVTVDQMLKRDMFVRRMQEEKPVYLHEFFYPLMQGYDSVVMDVDGEVGGNDQLFNMMMGRTLLKTLKNKDKFVITMKLLEDGSGKKMGKTDGNAVSLTDTPRDIYGKVMSWPDSLVQIAFELCTDLTLSEIKDFLAQETHPKKQKEKLAFEITKTIYSEKEATAAATFFSETFSEQKIPDQVVSIPKKETLKETLIVEGVVSSSSALRRLVEDGAITNITTGKVVTLEDLHGAPLSGVYKIGKKEFRKID